jgi:hypothetical protein
MTNIQFISKMVATAAINIQKSSIITVVLFPLFLNCRKAYKSRWSSNWANR